MDTTFLTALGLGLMLGVTHAFDPDHLVAVGTLAADSDSVRESSMLGIVWGIGHTIALGLVGGTVLWLEQTIPSSVALGMEGIVGMMIVILGGRLLWRTMQRPLAVHSHPHRHGSHAHRHFHIHDAEPTTPHHHGESSRLRALAVGLVHGLAGSAALSVLVMASMPTLWLGLVYIVVFGIGSIGGMSAMSALMSLPFVWRSFRWTRWHRRIRVGTALAAIGFGTYMTWTVFA